MALVVALAGGGCGRAAREPAGGVGIVFRHGKLFGDPEAFAGLLRDFEARHPGIHVRDETLPSASDVQHQYYALNLRAGSTAFDVLAIDVVWVAEFARAGWIADVSELLPGDERAAFFAGPIEAVRWAGRVWAVPWYVDAGLLYYRRDLLERHGRPPPRTWPELVDTARAVTAREPGLFGFVWQGKQYEGLVCNTLEYLWSNGGGVLEGGRVVLDRAANREALEFVRALVHRDRVTPASVTTATEEPSRHLFGRGRALFLRNWPYAWALFERPGSPVRGRVGIAPLPHFPGHASAATLGGWQLAVNARSRQPAAARALVRFLASEDSMRRLALAYGFQPARRSLYRDPALRAVLPVLATLEQVFATARPRPVTPDYVRLSQVMQGAFSAVLAGTATPATALALAHRALEEVLADAR